jgi:nitrite reductase/ring-hydroxylating ferredoxin subunit
MVYRRRIGVDNAPEAPAPEKWTAVLPLSELAANQARRVEVEGAPVLVYNDGQSLYAIGAVCSHAGGPLEEGKFEGHCVECPWHQSVFDLRNGEVVHGPATQRQQNYAVRVRNEQIEVRGAPAGEEQQARLPASRPAQERLKERAVGK